MPDAHDTSRARGIREQREEECDGVWRCKAGKKGEPEAAVAGGQDDAPEPDDEPDDGEIERADMVQVTTSAETQWTCGRMGTL